MRADGPAPFPWLEAGEAAAPPAEQARSLAAVPPPVRRPASTTAITTLPRPTPQAAPVRPAPDAQLPTDLDVYREQLRALFGYPEFRSAQAEVLTRLAAGDVLGVMPTGAGKSLCYVLPAIEVGMTLVVSPLIALMQDQVESLNAVGVPATFINSTLARDEQNRRYREFIEGRAPLLYVAPERLANPRFVEGLRAAGIRLLVIDEAHCISEWGHDFRPDYLALGVVRERLGAPRTLALTATADPTVRRDILVRLGVLGRAQEVVTSFDRPTLRFGVVPVLGDAERLQWLVRYAREHLGQAGIIYARTRRNVEATAAALTAAGVRAVAYHAGMAAADRAHAQRRFTTGQVPVLVATNAFGMGIDKPDVRYVIHTHMPGRLEAYYQEAGRAGRDGEPAECTLLYARRDAGLQRRFIEQAHPSEPELRTIWRQLVELQQQAGDRALTYNEVHDTISAEGLPVAIAAFRASELIEPAAIRLRSMDAEAAIDSSVVVERLRYAESSLAQMVEYAETSGCRRALILRYFGEQPAERCTGCDNCEGVTVPSVESYPDELFAALLELRTDLAADSGRPPYMVFEERTAREVATYRPSTPDELLTMWGMGETRVRWFGDRMLAAVRSWEAANGDAPPPPSAPSAPPPPRSGRAASDASNTTAEVSYNDPLYQRLRAWRRDRARTDGVPAYTLFTDRTARELAAHRPADEDALRSVWGMGEARVRAFGQDLLVILSNAD